MSQLQRQGTDIDVPLADILISGTGTRLFHEQTLKMLALKKSPQIFRGQD